MGTATANRTNGSEQTNQRARGGVIEPVSRRFTWAQVTAFPENPPVSEVRVARLRNAYNGYNHAIIGTPELADNAANAFPSFPLDTIFVVDGNNRLKIAQLENALDQEFIGKLWRGLTSQQMHELCLGGDDRRSIKPAERFLRLLAMGNPRKQAINAVVADMGWRVTYEREDGGLSCTHELEWIWSGGRPKSAIDDKSHRAALVKTIETYERSFGRKGQSRQSNVIKGIGAFWLLYPEIEVEALVRALDGLDMKDLYEKARQRRVDLRMAHLFNGMVDVLRHRYNSGRSSGRLPERRL